MSDFIFDPCPHCGELVENIKTWPSGDSSLPERLDWSIEIQPCGHTTNEISIHAWPVIDENGNEFPDPPYQVRFEKLRL